MRLIHLLAAALLTIPTISMAQAMERGQPSSSPAGPPSSSGGSSGMGPSTSRTGAAASVTAGLPVRDKNGATIGSVADVKTDASGNKVATIKMGADTFAVDASALAVDNGAAVINSTQAELKSMLPKGK
jgi:hypothetical protein